MTAALLASDEWVGARVDGSILLCTRVVDRPVPRLELGFAGKRPRASGTCARERLRRRVVFAAGVAV
jgi:hypothetical protein